VCDLTKRNDYSEINSDLVEFCNMDTSTDFLHEAILNKDYDSIKNNCISVLFANFKNDSSYLNVLKFLIDSKRCELFFAECESMMKKHLAFVTDQLDLQITARYRNQFGHAIIDDLKILWILQTLDDIFDPNPLDNNQSNITEYIVCPKVHITIRKMNSIEEKIRTILESPINLTTRLKSLMTHESTYTQTHMVNQICQLIHKLRHFPVFDVVMATLLILSDIDSKEAQKKFFIATSDLIMNKYVDYVQSHELSLLQRQDFLVMMQFLYGCCVTKTHPHLFHKCLELLDKHNTLFEQMLGRD
jgi:hypothetical protein